MTFSIFKKWWAWVIIVIVAFVAAGSGYFYGLVKSYQEAIESGELEIPQNFTPLTNVPTTVSTKDGVSLIRPGNPSFGPENARLVVIEFGDFQCPYCRQVFPTVRSLMNTYKDSVQFVFRQFPVSDAHPFAIAAARASLCAGDQGKFWQYHDVLFTNQEQISEGNLVPFAERANLDVKAFSDCMLSKKFDSDIENDYNDGIALGVRGTPTFFFNGIKVDGAIPEDAFRQIIEEFLK